MTLPNEALQPRDYSTEPEEYERDERYDAPTTLTGAAIGLLICAFVMWIAWVLQ